MGNWQILAGIALVAMLVFGPASAALAGKRRSRASRWTAAIVVFAGAAALLVWQYSSWLTNPRMAGPYVVSAIVWVLITEEARDDRYGSPEDF